MTVNIEYEAEKQLEIPYEEIIRMWRRRRWLMRAVLTRQRSMWF